MIKNILSKSFNKQNFNKLASIPYNKRILEAEDFIPILCYYINIIIYLSLQYKHILIKHNLTY